MFQILLYNSNFLFLNLAKQINFQFYFYLDIVFKAHLTIQVNFDGAICK